MPPPIREVIITAAALEPPPLAYNAEAGGVVDFHGVVRGQEGAEAIGGIDYQTHLEMARHQFDLLVQETVALFAVHDLIVHHRIGFVPTAAPSLFLRVSAAHHGPAFAAAEWFIDEMKQRIPIWKHPVSQLTGGEVGCASAVNSRA